MSQTFLEANDFAFTHEKKRGEPLDLIARFLRHVSISPTAIALVTTEETWTYQRLYQDVLKWKVILSQHVETRVIVFLTRTPRMIPILLALQWLRVTYVPVDSSTPVARLLSIIEDSQAETLLHDMTSLSQDFSCVVLNVENLDHHYIDSPNTPLLSPSRDALAYVIYTSGSTGKPKGVAISYHALNHFLSCMSRVFLQEENAMLLAVTTLAFDIAQLELWLPLWQKRPLFLATQVQHRDPILLKSILNEYPITLLQSTPAFWSMLYAVGWEGKPGLVALCGGEALSQALAEQLLKSVASLWNMYGPTEATVWCAMKKLTHHTSITVGKPLPGMSFLVLDEKMRQCPAHVKGELYIGGVGLAKGYVNREDLNHERFITLDGARLYRVGDFAMETADGEFVILGRTDNQIKLHGYRIELEEIEACLKQYPPVSNAAVIVEHEQLLAYLSVSNESYSESDLKDMLKQVLPVYMIPVRFILLEALPLTLGGKVDRQALPKSSIKTASLVCDATALEISLCGIWQNALRCPVTPLDNFFALGGHSLIAARIVAEIAEKLGKSLTLDALYHAPTVRALAYLLEKASSHRDLSVTLPKLGTWFSLTDYQAMFWLSQRFEPGLKVFNVVARRRFQENLEDDLLNKALAFVFEKHHILSYRLNRFYPAQRFTFVAPMTWQKTRLCGADTFEEILSTSYDDLFYRHRWRPDQPMIVAKLFYLPKAQTELQVCISHLIADDRALDIFFEDVYRAYQHYRMHGRAPIQKPVVSFAYYASKAQARFQIKQEEKIAFWSTYLADTGYFPMPRKYIISKMTQDVRHYVTEVDFPRALLDTLQSICGQHRLTLNDILTAAVGLALQQCTQIYPHSILINTVKSARTEARFDETIGCFLEMMVVKLDLKVETTLLEAAKAVQRSWMETLHYQDVPSLVKYASIGQSVAGLGRLKRAMIRGIMAFYGKLVQRRIKDVRLFEACAKVARQERKRHFFVSVNLLNSFITPTMHTTQMKEMGISSHPFPVMPLTSVLDVWFYGEHGVLQPKLLVAANLTTAFRERFVNTLLELLQEAKKGE